MTSPSGYSGVGSREGAGVGGGPWEQLVASLLAQHTALLHKLAAAAPLTCASDTLTHPHSHTCSPALSLGHYARRNWRNRRNRQRKKLRRLYNNSHQNPSNTNVRKGWRGSWQRRQQNALTPTSPPAATTTTTHVRRTLRSVVRYLLSCNNNHSSSVVRL